MTALDPLSVCKAIAPYLGATDANDWTGLKDDDAVSMPVKMRVGDLRALKAVAAEVPALTADFARALPGGGNDDSTFEQIEDALDKAFAPMREGGKPEQGKWLTLPERIDGLAAQRDAVLGAAGFKPMDGNGLNPVVMADIAGMRPAMVKARRQAKEAQSTADLWRRFVAEGGLGNGLLLRLWRMIVAYRAAMTPSAATKFVHIGEYYLEIQGPPDPEIELEEGEEGEPTTIRVPVPWDTVKTIMSAIRADAERDINR